MSDTYYTLESSIGIEHHAEDSRFLADAFPVESRKRARDRIAATREREPHATHHCMAYRLGAAGDAVRWDDDGEPSGTAGPPILRQIEARDLTNTLVVVTRYFGGTKLGTGGLVRAYGDAASLALDQASIVERVVRSTIRLRFAYDDTSPARQILERFDAKIQDSEYTDVTTLTIGVRQSDVEAFVKAFTNALSGRGEVRRQEEGRSEG